MKISNIALLSGAVALLVVSSTTQAADTDVQARMRDALRQRMQELGPETTDAPAKTKAVKPKATKAPAPAVVSPEPAVTTTTVTTTTTTGGADDRMQQALQARLEAEKQNSAAAATAATQTQGSELQPVVTSTKVTKAKPAPAILEAPASPIPATKEARLAELLQQYKADQITPEQYHSERAKIIAEP